MRVCVYGAGAVGGHLAARLARGGAEVSVVLRGPALDAVRARGLSVHAPDGVLACRPAASDDPADLGPQDAVIVSVKGPALPSVAAGIAPLLGPDTPVAFVMNGVPWWYFDRHGGPLEGTPLPALDPGGAVRRAVGVGRAIGGVVYSACTVVEPGVVRVGHDRDRLVLGEPGGGPSPRAERLAALLRAGGFGAEVSPDIRRELWLKLVANLSNGALCLLSRSSLAETLAEPAPRRAAEETLAEAARIAEALLGAPLGLDAPARAAAAAALDHRPSILQDLEAGKPVEIEAMLLQPLALARLAGVSTPLLDLTVALARQAAEAAGLYRPPAG